MGIINLLDKSVAELIAAGEVIERPASVVKELVENSIDAGANKIKIEIKNGGVTYIKITDNGCGIKKDDIKKAFLRHATSKVLNVDDLDNILTLGFRGEALASISAVAKIELITKTKDDIDGSRYFLNTEKHGLLEDFGTTVGTTIIIRDLFFNVPARMKFLKKDVTEGNAVANIIEKLALSHPEISFTFIRDGQEKLSTFGDNDLLSTIYSIFGKDFATKLLPLEYSENYMNVKGYISNPSDSKGSRTFQNFFVNSRYVKSKTCCIALEEAYKSFITQGRFPACVLNVSIPSSVIDINVHPAKLEIRFSNEKNIYNLVYSAVKNCILSHSHNPVMTLKHKPHKFESLDEKLDDLIQNSSKPMIKSESENGGHYFFSATAPKLFFTDEKLKSTQNSTSFKHVFETVSQTYENLKKQNSQNNNLDENTNNPNLTKEVTTAPNQPDIINKNTTVDFKNQIDTSQNVKTQSQIIKEKEIKNNYPSQQLSPIENETISSFYEDYEAINNAPKLIGEIFNSYIILEQQDKIIFIDKHAAHERLIYEKIKDGYSRVNRQILLSPQTITLSLQEYQTAIDNIKIFEDIGFLIEDFGNKTIIVREIPNILDDVDIVEIINEIINNIIENKNNVTPHIIEKIYFTFACKAAIKAGDKNNDLELKELIKLLEENKNLKNCPHGRPIFFELNKKSIERQFLRWLF